MFGLGAPLWLLALAVLPLVRWLHRWQAPLAELDTGAGFLWRDGEAQRPGAAAERPPDPAWRLRALIAALVILALAEPMWSRAERTVTVWVDDSLSMLTTEHGQSRLAHGLDRLAAALDEGQTGLVTLRSLTDPTAALAADAPGALSPESWRRETGTPVSPPPPALMDSSSAHWLLGDGADSRIAGWAETAPIERMILTGEATDNAAVSRLAVRRHPADPRRLRVLVAASNRSRSRATRRLILESDGEPVENRPIELPPGGQISFRFEIPAGTGRLAARIAPGDVLAADDVLAVSLDDVRPVPVRVDPACPAELGRALRQHPGLAPQESAPALQIVCGRPPVAGIPAVILHSGPTERIAAAPTWAPGDEAAGAPRLREAWLATTGWPDEAAGRGYETVLQAGDEPLIRRASRPFPIVESVIDMSARSLVRQPEYALLVDTLAALALGRSPLDPVIVGERSPGESDIAPLAMPPVHGPSAPASAARASLTPALIAAALLLLVLDLLRTVLAARRIGRA
jgi:hypothetical protein